MSAAAVATAIREATGLPCAVGGWPAGQAPEPPYVAVVPSDTRQLYADDSVWWQADRLSVELYEQGAPAYDATAIEAALAGLSMPWAKGYSPVPEGHLFETWWMVTDYRD